MPEPLDLATVEISRFEPLLHEKFLAKPWEGPDNQTALEFELVRAVPYHLGAPGGQRPPFSLFFNGPAGVHLGQGTYTVTHPHTGDMSLFLVPVARKGERVQLQAVLS